MFGIDWSELAVVAVLAAIFIGPKDLPRVMRTAGHWVRRVRRVQRHVTSELRKLAHEAELQELENKWRAENHAMFDLQTTNFHPSKASSEPAVPASRNQPQEGRQYELL